MHTVSELQSDEDVYPVSYVYVIHLQEVQYNYNGMEIGNACSICHPHYWILYDHPMFEPPHSFLT